MRTIAPTPTVEQLTRKFADPAIADKVRTWKVKQIWAYDELRTIWFHFLSSPPKNYKTQKPQILRYLLLEICKQSQDISNVPFIQETILEIFKAGRKIAPEDFFPIIELVIIINNEELFAHLSTHLTNHYNTYFASFASKDPAEFRYFMEYLFSCHADACHALFPHLRKVTSDDTNTTSLHLWASHLEINSFLRIINFATQHQNQEFLLVLLTTEDNTAEKKTVFSKIQHLSIDDCKQIKTIIENHEEFHSFDSIKKLLAEVNERSGALVKNQSSLFNIPQHTDCQSRDARKQLVVNEM